MRYLCLTTVAAALVDLSAAWSPNWVAPAAAFRRARPASRRGVQIARPYDNSADGFSAQGEVAAAADVHGLSVSEAGFTALFKTDGEMIIAVQVDEQADSSDSVEALTLLQLFQGIDMAGAVFPPDILAVRVAEHIGLKFTFSGKEIEYNEAGEWLRARAKLPRVQLHSIVLSDEEEESTTTRGDLLPSGLRFSLRCSCTSLSSTGVKQEELSVPLFSVFEAVALVLRYQKQGVPLELDPSVTSAMEAAGDSCMTSKTRACVFDLSELSERFPLFRSKEDAMAQNARVSSKLSNAFEVNTLEAALRMAVQKGDKAAEEKIRLALKKFETFPEDAEPAPTMVPEPASPALRAIQTAVDDAAGGTTADDGDEEKPSV